MDDFMFSEAEGSIHVINAPSPAATSSLAIGETVASKALKNLGLGS
jgi:L-2-hydroxyglutarate oxidase